MPDHNAAVTLTAAAVVAAILIARAAAVRHGGRGRASTAVRAPRRRAVPLPHAPSRPAATPRADSAHAAVRDAERHVHRCWQRLQAQTDPPD